MKKIGVIAALNAEIAPFLEEMDIHETQNIAGTAFYTGTLRGTTFVLARSRVGKVNGAICAQLLIDRFAVDCVIVCGVAGALAAHVDCGDVVLARDLVQHDYDSTGDGWPPGVNGSIDTSFFEVDEALLRAAKAAFAEASPTAALHLGRIATGDQFVTDIALHKKIAETFDALCVDMESAAIAQTCYLNDVPFVVIRAISDNADQNAPEMYSQFEKRAVANAYAVTAALLGGMGGG